MELETAARPDTGRQILASLDELAELCEPMLTRMRIVHGPDRDLFCHRLRRIEGGAMEQVGVSVRYSAMAMLGVAACYGSAALREDPWRRTMTALGRYAGTPANLVGLGDLGLLLWLDESAGGSWTAPLVDELRRRLPRALRWADAMDRAWLLTGLALNTSMEETSRRELSAVALEALLECHNPATDLTALDAYRPHGLWTCRRFRAVRGSFATQVYPLFALSMYLGRNREARIESLVERAAARICSMQGEAGEWWWIFDVRRGRVTMDFPVYSVHQDGMAPMALLAAGEAIGRQAYLPAVAKGLDYLFDYREPRTGDGFIDRRDGMIWRAVIKDTPGEDAADLPFGLPAQDMSWIRSGALPGFLGAGGPADTPDRCILQEARPYCAGWILYARSMAARLFGGDTASPAGRR